MTRKQIHITTGHHIGYGRERISVLEETTKKIASQEERSPIEMVNEGEKEFLDFAAYDFNKGNKLYLFHNRPTRYREDFTDLNEV